LEKQVQLKLNGKRQLVDNLELAYRYMWDTPSFIYISVIFLDRSLFEYVLLYFLT
jgi:hypothetical protein